MKISSQAAVVSLVHPEGIIWYMELRFWMPFVLTLTTIAAPSQSSVSAGIHPDGSLSLSPRSTQEIKQPPGTSFNVSISDGEINEELLQGGTVPERVNAAIEACGSSYLKTCIIKIPVYAPSGYGWHVPPNNTTVEDRRNLNGFGYPDGELTGMRANIHYIYHAGANDPSEARCQFCGKNVLLVDAIADAGSSTTGSNASLQAIVGSVHRMAESTRQIWAGNFVANYRNLKDMASGIEVDTSNESPVDDVGLKSAGVRIVNNGRRSGIGLRINSVLGGDGRDGLPAFRGYMVGIDDEDYHVYGLKMNSRDANRAADIYIVAGNNTESSSAVVVRDASDKTTVASIQNDGSAAFTRVSGRLEAIGGVVNRSGLQHFRGSVGCTTEATAGSLCRSPDLPLPVQFADTNYTITCSLEERVGQPTVIDVIKGLHAVNIEIAATNNNAATAHYDCIAMHD